MISRSRHWLYGCVKRFIVRRLFSVVQQNGLSYKICSCSWAAASFSRKKLSVLITCSIRQASASAVLFSIDSMTPTANDSESVCAYQFDIENRSYLLDDSRDYVDAIVRESEDDYKYYGKHLSDAEISRARRYFYYRGLRQSRQRSQASCFGESNSSS